jgi:hypothetical protein
MFPIAFDELIFIANELTTGVVKAPAVTPSVPPVPVKFNVVNAAESIVEAPKFVSDTVLIVFATVADAALLSAIVTAPATTPIIPPATTVAPAAAVAAAS